jgi:hypothetical protein
MFVGFTTGDGGRRSAAAEGLEDENRRLKQLVADLSLDKEALEGDRTTVGMQRRYMLVLNEFPAIPPNQTSMPPLIARPSRFLTP